MIQYKSDVDVRLIQKMGGDHMIVAAAKVSTNGIDALEFAQPGQEDKNQFLINYLVKMRHGTPFEHSALTFFVHAPIFVWREWHRHRIGFCVSGGTEVWLETISPNCGRTVRKRKIRDVWKHWHVGVTDKAHVREGEFVKERTRLLPSCRNLTARVLNEETNLFELGRIRDVYKSGMNEIFLLKTDDPRWNTLKCSRNHKILTADGWAEVGDLSGDEYVYVSGKRNSSMVSVPPSLRRGIGVWTSMQRNKLILPTDHCYICNGVFDRDELILDHVIPVVKDLQRALDPKNLLPTCAICHRRKSDSEQHLATRNIVAGSKLSRLLGKPIRIGEKMTYDIEMEAPWHNFVANGIIVHNSYNEESARYKKLEPLFYLPDRERPMMKVDNWKPGRPRFLRCENDDVYNNLITNLKHAYSVGYDMYEANLKLNIDPGLARDCLNFGIYSGCWVTCNPRSLMAFLSLRHHDPDATFVSYPLWEIDLAAQVAESFLKEGWPITHKAFVENGRVAP